MRPTEHQLDTRFRRRISAHLHPSLAQSLRRFALLVIILLLYPDLRLGAEPNIPRKKKTIPFTIPEGPPPSIPRSVLVRGLCGAVDQACTWERTLGGPGADRAHAIAPMPDDGMVVVGDTGWLSGPQSGWIVRLDRSGQPLWEKRVGGRDSDQIYAVAASSEGGVVAVGHSRSDGAGESDFWIVSLDGKGDVLWHRLYGGEANDRGRALAIDPTSGDLLVAGFTRSKGAGAGDGWLIRLNAAGKMTWNGTFGGPGEDAIYDIEPVAGGWLLAGYKQFSDARGYDLWVVKVDTEGRKLWERTFDRNTFDAASSIEVAPDGRILVVGQTTRSMADSDAWLIALGSDGQLLWERSDGGSKIDVALDVALDDDGLWVVAVATSSFGSGSHDTWVLGLNDRGVLIWERIYGGATWDTPAALELAANGDLLIAGSTAVSRTNREDFWLLRLNRRGDFYE